MMEVRRLFECTVAVVVALFFSRGYAQECNSIINITSVSAEVELNSSLPRICIQCVDSEGIHSPSTSFTIGGVTLSLNGLAMNGAQNINSVLVIDDPFNYIMPGTTATAFSCIGGGTLAAGVSLFSTVILPLIPDNFVVTVNEQSQVPVLQACSNPNRRSLFVPGTEIIVDPNGNTISPAFIHQFVNVVRTEAGMYACEVGLPSGGKLSTSFELIVQYHPNATTTEPMGLIDFNLDGSFSVSCDFVGIPIPTVQWTQNDTVLSDTDPSVTISTTEVMSMLTLTNLERDGGGRYNCIVENLLGSVNQSVIEVRILIPPAPIEDLMIINIMEEGFDITWSTGFDGFTAITGAIVEYTDGGTDTLNMTVTDSAPTGTTLTNLNSFRDYNISVVLTNVVGSSDPVVSSARTLSLVLGSPVDINLTAISSTELRLDWNPPGNLPGTDPSDMWCIEYFLANGTGETTSRTINDPSTTTASFTGLLKGTFYCVRVAGNNIRGKGVWSMYFCIQTIVDPPSEPRNVVVTGISSFSLRINWEPSLDNGGQNISGYNLEIIGSNGGASNSVNGLPGTTTSHLFVDESFLTENTTYSVNVSAFNIQGGTGSPGVGTGSTLPITDPQPILEVPTTDEVENITALILWDDPGGNVDEYIVVYTELLTNMEFNVTVNGNETSVELVDLSPSTTYSVTIFTINSNGMSAVSSPEFSFNTAPAPDPVIMGPDQAVMESVNVILTCTSPNDKVIAWSRQDGAPLNPPVFDYDAGAIFTSTLTIRDIRYANRGIYVCRVGQESREFELLVIQPTEIPTTVAAPTFGTMAIIIVAVVGGGALIIAVLAFIFIVVCCCCCRNKEKKGRNVLTSKSLRPDKRTNDLFEVSTYVPISDGANAGKQDTGVSFHMPEEYQTHSSFNTLDKPDKRSTSPDLAAPISFGGGNRSSTDNLTTADHSGFPAAAYQDMPPSYDGAVDGGGTML